MEDACHSRVNYEAIVSSQMIQIAELHSIRALGSADVGHASLRSDRQIRPRRRSSSDQPSCSRHWGPLASVIFRFMTTGWSPASSTTSMITATFLLRMEGMASTLAVRPSKQCAGGPC